ncbi:MAG TPA: BrnA antitoxin family protein [Rhodothermia bacterium]|nr:BrnA antitoxin family protein [Rhodothermia bacterium]
MKRKGTIVRYSAEEIKEMLDKGLDRTDWERLRNMTEEEVERNALEENRRLGIPDDWYEDAVLMKGPPTAANLICVDHDVLEYFRGLGKGYRRRMNDVLRAFMEEEQKR